MRLKDENADLKRRLEELEEKHKYTNRQFWNVLLYNVISNNCSPFSHRLHPRVLQRAEIEIERLISKETSPLASLFYCLLQVQVQESKFGMEMPKVPVLSRYFVAYLASFVAVGTRCSLLSSQGCSLLSGQGQATDWDRQVVWQGPLQIGWGNPKYR